MSGDNSVIEIVLETTVDGTLQNVSWEFVSFEGN